MDKPICKLCGGKHYSTEPHKWGNDPADQKPKPTRQVKQTKPANPTGFDRKAYQREYMREYMRKRRAQAKLMGS